MERIDLTFPPEIWHIGNKDIESMEQFLRVLQTKMDVPQPFGSFHLIAVFLVILCTVAVCANHHNADEKTYRRVLVTIWTIMVVLEAIKQVIKSYSFTPEGEIVWAYCWDAFPLQLCDSPFYLLLPIAFLPNGRLRDALSAYMYTYVLLGGVSTFILISTTFTSTVYFNVHTLAHHGLQVIACIFIAVRNRERIAAHSFPDALLVFLIAVSIATTFNVVMHLLVPDQVINMFFISPYFKKTMPILNEEWKNLHWIPTIMLYISGVSLIAYSVFRLFKKVFHTAPQKEVAAAREKRRETSV